MVCSNTKMEEEKPVLINLVSCRNQYTQVMARLHYLVDKVGENWNLVWKCPWKSPEYHLKVYVTSRFDEVVDFSLLPTSTGNYMYIETSSPRQQGDKAKLNSPGLQFSGSMCLKFYYHMYGADIATLNVMINGNNVFSASGDKGNRWLRAAIDVSLWGRHAVREIIMPFGIVLPCFFQL